MPENKPAKPIDDLLVQRHVAELVHRGQEREMAAAILMVASRIIAATTLENEAALEASLSTFRLEVKTVRAHMRAGITAKAMIKRATGGGHAH